MNPHMLLGHGYTLGGTALFQPYLLPSAGLSANGIPIKKMPGNMSQAKVTVDATNTVNAAPEQLKAYSFLPWEPSAVTYLKIPRDAQLVLTGPLSACTVWAFETGGDTVLIHANANSDTAWSQMTDAEKRANMATKMAAVNRIKAHYGGGTDLARLAYAQSGVHGGPVIAYDGYQGFVLGCKPRCGFSSKKAVGYGSARWVTNSQGEQERVKDPTKKGAFSFGSSGWTFYFYGYNGPGVNDRVLWPLS